MKHNAIMLLLVGMMAWLGVVGTAWGQESPREMLEAGRALYVAGDYAGAEGKFRVALEAQPRDYIALCLLGATCLQQGKMDEAKAALDGCLEIHPDYVPVLVNLGAWHLKNGNPAQAVEVLETTVKEGHASIEAYFDLGSAYLALGQPQKAMDNFSQAAQLGMKAAELNYANSLALGALGRLPEALTEAKSACDAAPGEARYWLRLGRLESESGNVTGAWDALTKALQLAPGQEAAGIELVRLVEANAAQLADRVQELEALDEANPGSFYLGYAIGALYLGKNDLAKAEVAFQKAVQEVGDKDQARASARLGLVYLLEENWQSAADALDKSIAADPSVAGVHSNLALALFHLGQWDRYEAELKKVLELEPGNVGAIASLGNLYAYRSEWDKAEEQYRLALEQKGTDADLLGKIGRCQLGKKDWQAAITTLQQAVQIKADSAQLFFLLGAGYEGWGEWEKALDAYKKALEIDPNHQGAKERILALGGGG